MTWQKGSDTYQSDLYLRRCTCHVTVPQAYEWCFPVTSEGQSGGELRQSVPERTERAEARVARLREDLLLPLGREVPKAAGQTPGHSFRPSEPQVADRVMGLAGNGDTTTHKPLLCSCKTVTAWQDANQVSRDKPRLLREPLTTCRPGHNARGFFTAIALRPATPWAEASSEPQPQEWGV